MSYRRPAGVALCTAALLVPAAPAWAATVYSVRPELSVSETYDDNIDRVEENQREDFITTVGAGLTLAARNPRLTASASYEGEAEFFARETEDQGQLSHTGSLSVAYQAARRLTLRLGGSALVTEVEASDAELAVPGPEPEPGPGPAPTEPPPAAEPGSIPTGRARQISGTVRAGLEYQYGALTGLTAGYEYATTRYDAPGLVDTSTHSVSLGAARQLTAADHVGVEYRASLFQFDEPGRPDRQAHEAVLGWQRDLSPSVTASLAAGVSLAERETGSGFEAGAVGSAGLTRRVGPTRYSARYERLVSTSGGTGTLQHSDRVSLGIAHAFTAAVSGELGVAYARNRDVEGAAGATDSYSATAGLTARLTRSLQGFLGYAFERADAPAGGSSFTQNRVTAGLTFVFPDLQTAAF